MTTNEQSQLCDRIRRVGYARGNQVRLYGEIFDLVSDPFVLGESVVFLDGIQKRSGRAMRVRVPLSIVRMARSNSHTEAKAA